MAIEIKELIIKMTVNSKGPEKSPVSGEMSPSAKNRLVQECVEKVLAKLQSKLER